MRKGMSETDVQILKKDVTKILNYLHNDEGTGEKGLIADFKAHKKEFQDFRRTYEDTQLIRKTAYGIYGFFGAGIMLFAKWLLGLILPHLHI